MSSYAVSLPPFPTTKRSACDRCRSQELRCPPRELGTDSCTRCTRLGAKCITSYPAPAGHGQPRRANQLAPQPPPPFDLTPKASGSGLAPSCSSKTTTLFQSTQPLDTHDSFPISVPEDDLGVFTFMPMEPTVPDASMFFNHIQHEEETGGQPYDDLDDFSGLHSLPALTNASSADSTDAAKEVRQQNGGLINELVFGCDQRLSSLNLDLSRRLQQSLATTQPQDSPMPDMNSDPPAAADSGKTGLGRPLCSELLGDALSDTSEFLAIIQSLAPERRGSSSGTIPKPTPHLGIIVVLNLLSVYLQLVVVYEKLFQCLSSLLFNTSVGSVVGLEALLGSQLAGFSVQRGNLQTKILIHAILHQFEMIERILGLPAEFRVTEKQDDYSGLFEDGRTGELLQAMGNERWCQAAIDESFGLKAISSLREMLKRAQISLDM